MDDDRLESELQRRASGGSPRPEWAQRDLLPAVRREIDARPQPVVTSRWSPLAGLATLVAALLILLVALPRVMPQSASASPSPASLVPTPSASAAPIECRAANGFGLPVTVLDQTGLVTSCQSLEVRFGEMTQHPGVTNPDGDGSRLRVIWGTSGCVNGATARVARGNGSPVHVIVDIAESVIVPMCSGPYVLDGFELALRENVAAANVSVFNGVAQPTPQPSSSTPAGPTASLGCSPVPEGPTIDWDHPFRTEGRQNVDPAAVAADPAAFNMPIRPITPQLSSGRLRWVDVSAAGTIAYMYDFSGEPGFAADPRAQVEEWKSDFTQDELIHTQWNPVKPSMTDVGPITILVFSAGCGGEAWFVHEGIFFEVTGPALQPMPAFDIASQIANQLVGASASPTPLTPSPSPWPSPTATVSPPPGTAIECPTTNHLGVPWDKLHATIYDQTGLVLICTTPKTSSGTWPDPGPMVINPGGDKMTLRIGWPGDPCDAQVDLVVSASNDGYTLEGRHTDFGGCIYPGVTHVIDVALSEPVDASAVTAVWVDGP